MPESKNIGTSLGGIRSQIHKCYRSLRSKRITAIAFSSVSVMFILLLIFLIVEHFQYFSPIVKTSFGVFIVASGVALFILLARKFKNLTFNTFYPEVSRSIGNDSVRYLMDFEHFKRNDAAGLQEAAIAQNLGKVSGDKLSVQLHDYSKNHPYKKLYNYSLFSFLFLTVLFGWTSIFSPDAIKRTAFFWKEFEKPLPFTYSIDPGNTIIAQGDPFQAKITFGKGRAPENITLAIKTDVESEFRLRPMDQGDDNSFVSDDMELYNNARYYIQMDEHDSETFEADVQLLPRFGSLTATLTPPAYTGIDDKESTYPFSGIEAYPGSELLIEAETNKELIMGQLIRHSSKDTLGLMPDDENRVIRKLNISGKDSLSFIMKDKFGLTNSNPYAFEVLALQDERPFVGILQPDRQLSIRNPEELQVSYEIEDDFGFTSVDLHFKLNKAYVDQPVTGSIDLPVPKGSGSLDRHDWNLSELDLRSLDKMEYWIEATDNDEVSGYKTSRSESHFLNIQSLADQMFEQEESEDQINESYDQVQDVYQQMQDNFQRFREQVQNDPDATWEQSQILEDIKDQREDLDQQVEDLKNKFDELTENMENSKTLSEETMQQYKELNELIDEIDDPEIMKLIEELQNNLGDFDQSELRNALEEIEFNESSYQERMERTVELFKTLRLNAELEIMAELLKDLETQEQQLMNQDDVGDEQVQQQENIKQQLEDLAEKIDDLPDKSPIRQKDRMEQLRDELEPDMDSMEQQLQENIKDMQQDIPDQERIKQDQDRLQQQMGEMSQKLSDSRQEMGQEQIQVNITALKNILQSLILLSVAQEDVTVQTEELAQNSPGFVGQTRSQRNINRNFEYLVDSLYQVSSEIPQFSNQINERKREIQHNMQRALDYLVGRDRSKATTVEQTALGGLNELGSMLADLIDQLNDQMNGNNGMGGMSAEQMMEQMQGLSGDQQQLNQRIQDMINDMAGERLSQDQTERLNQMARQQNEIRKQMRELQRSGGLESGDNILSEMERMGEEMENAINELRGGQLDEVMVERQQNILSRMLEAEEAIEERDQDEEQRRGETAEDYELSNPSELALEELRQKVRAGIQDADQTRFSDDYQRLIERYFELLEEMTR
ncbi:MAG: hypothetical protein WEB89_10135 [Balneolales bacterium]